MNKFALILLYALAITFTIQYLFPPQKTTDIAIPNILIAVDKASIVIPNIPKVSIINTTASGFTLLPCRDLTLSIDSQPVTDIEKLAPGFCSKIEVGALKTEHISLGDLAKIFATKAGKYVFSLKTPIGDRLVTFDVSEPGAFRSFLMKVIYEPIYNLFVALLTFLPGHALGWAIVIITLIVRLILLVPQHHMLESQKKLQVIQPKIKALQTKHKDDQSKLGMEMLELYKKE